MMELDIEAMHIRGKRFYGCRRGDYIQFVVDGNLSKRICGRRVTEYNVWQVGPFDHDVVFEGLFKSDKKRKGWHWSDVAIGHVP